MSGSFWIIANVLLRVGGSPGSKAYTTNFIPLATLLMGSFENLWSARVIPLSLLIEVSVLSVSGGNGCQ